MSWIPLTSESQLAEIIQISATKPQVIFKHSTRCNVSSMALNRMEKFGLPAHIDYYLLDLITYRNLSTKIADTFQVFHESPQVLMIQNGVCTFDESHLGIQPKEIVEQAES